MTDTGSGYKRPNDQPTNTMFGCESKLADIGTLQPDRQIWVLDCFVSCHIHFKCPTLGCRPETTGRGPSRHQLFVFLPQGHSN